MERIEEVISEREVVGSFEVGAFVVGRSEEGEKVVKEDKREVVGDVVGIFVVGKVCCWNICWNICSWSVCSWNVCSWNVCCWNICWTSRRTIAYSERIMRFNQQPVSSPYLITERIYFGI